MTALQSSAVMRVHINGSREAVAQDSAQMMWPDTIGEIVES
jgi:hypothetical protein